MTRDELATALESAWNDICADTGCHPLDIERRSDELFFSPGHWVTLAAQLLESRERDGERNAALEAVDIISMLAEDAHRYGVEIVAIANRARSPFELVVIPPPAVKPLTGRTQQSSSRLSDPAQEVTEGATTIAKLEKMVYVPGVWRCAKCEFRLVQSNLNMGDGSVTARDDTGDKCPNCNSPLWRVSERDDRKEAYALVDKYFEDKARIDWLQEQIVDTIYLDDGRIIDVRGGDLRAALTAALQARGTK